MNLQHLNWCNCPNTFEIVVEKKTRLQYLPQTFKCNCTTSLLPQTNTLKSYIYDVIMEISARELSDLIYALDDRYFTY